MGYRPGVSNASHGPDFKPQDSDKSAARAFEKHAGGAVLWHGAGVGQRVSEADNLASGFVLGSTRARSSGGPTAETIL